MSLITAIRDLVLGYDDTHHIAMDNGRVTCPWNGLDQDIERCYTCPMFKGIDKNYVCCHYRSHSIYELYR